MFRFIQNSKGFTLVELLVVVVILTIITALSSEFIITMLGVAVKTNNKTSVEEDYTFMDLKLTKIIQDSSTFTCNLNCVNPSVLTFTRGSDTFTFSRGASNLFFKRGAESYEALSNNDLTDIVFSANNTTKPYNLNISFSILRDSENSRLKATTTFNKKFILMKTR